MGATWVLHTEFRLSCRTLLLAPQLFPQKAHVQEAQGSLTLLLLFVPILLSVAY